MNKNRYQQAEFILAAHLLKQLPADEGCEVAFAGRSNAGKSSVINTVVGQRGLARTSKTPGRTQQLVCFRVDETRRLMDLPGYGFANVPLKVKQHWGGLLEKYFTGRKSLVGLILIMDIRHPLKPYDRQMLDWAAANSLPVHILLNKSDKLSRGAALGQLDKVRSQVNPDTTLQLFSALKAQGVEEVRDRLDNWLGFEQQD